MLTVKNAYRVLNILHYMIFYLDTPQINGHYQTVIGYVLSFSLNCWIFGRAFDLKFLK